MFDPETENALSTLIEDCLYQERCFSAGELAATLRHRDPSLEFSVQGIAVRLDQMFESRELLYEIDDGPVAAVRVKRTTSGTVGRVPAGIQVWVYGPSLAAVGSHPFEIDIPAPPGQQPRVIASDDEIVVIDVTPITKPALASAADPSEEAEIRAALKAHADETTLQAAQRMRLFTDAMKSMVHAQASLIMSS